MAIIINDNYSLQRQNQAFDARYLDGTTPWVSVGAAEAGIPTYRYTGLTVNILGEEYWWKEGTDNGDLIPKQLGGSGTLSGATNGLSLFCSNTYVGLGGALTQNTTINGAYSLSLGDYVSGLTAISAVTPTFQITDEGVNSSLSWCHDQDTPHFDVCLYGENANSNADIILDVDVSQGCFSVSSAPNTTCCSALSLKTTDSNVAIYNAHSTNNVMHYVNEACIASSKLTCESLTDSSNAALNIKSVMDYDTRSWEFSKDNTTILNILSGGTARYGSNVTLANDCDLAHKWYVDNATGALSGANGLTKDGNNIVLGGTLTGDTTIYGDTNSINFNSVAQFNVTGGSATICADSIALCGCGTSCVEVGPSDVILRTNDFGNIIHCVQTSNRCHMFCGGDIYMPEVGTYTSETNVLYIDSAGKISSGATSIGSITGATNGLTASGQVVSLGGDLTGHTTIDGVGSYNVHFADLNLLTVTGVSTSICGTTNIALRTPSFTLHNGVGNVLAFNTTCNKITDIVNSEGLVYASNYCAVGELNPRWIPDVAYVTGLTSGFLNTASNGLTESGQDVKLGGTLTEATNICLGGLSPQTFQIKNSGSTTCTVLDVNQTLVQMCASNVNSPFQTSRMTVGVSGSVMCSGFVDCRSSISMANSIFHICSKGGANNAYLRVTDDTSSPKGLEYAACYHNTYCDRSLVDKEYVTSYVSGATSGITGAFTTANNGLCSSGQVVSLGGALTGNTTIDTVSHILLIEGNTLKITGMTTCIEGGITLINSTAVSRIGVTTGGDCSQITFAPTCMNIHDSFNNEGVVYGANYCTVGKINPRWIPDNEYVTGLTSQGITSGSNIGGGSEVFSAVTEQVASYRTIVGSGDTSVSTVGDKIIVFGTSGGTGLYDGQSPSAIEVGGIAAGTVISGCSFTQLWEDLLVPELYQTSVGTPSTSAGATLTGLREIGCTFSQTITPSYSAGAITPLYETTSPYTRGGVFNNYNYSGPSVSAGWNGASSCNIASYVVTIGTQTWSVCTRYDEGACIKGSKGTDNPTYPTVCAQDSITPAGNTSIIGAYPLWATCDNITTPLEKYSPLCNMATANNVVIDLCGETVTDKQKFAIPCAWLGAPTSRPLAGVSWWNNLAGSWVDETSNWSGLPSTETVQGNSIGYCEYTYGGDQRGGICIRLEF